MRFVDVVRASALLGSLALLAGCPNKDNTASPEPAATTATPPNGANDKAGAEAPAPAPAAPAPAAANTAENPTTAATPAAPAAAAPAPAAKPKKKEDQGGW
jgi:hypothetical protein